MESTDGNINQVNLGKQQAQSVKPVQAAATPLPEDKMRLLLELLVEDRTRELVKAKETEKSQEQRRQKYIQNRSEKRDRLFNKQKNCDHLKGGKIKSKQNKDYALWYHTYINRDQKIGCFVCGMKWFPGDTNEYLVRNGRKISNHTKIGWDQAKMLFTQSSNGATLAEIPFDPISPTALAGGEDLGPAEAQ